MKSLLKLLGVVVVFLLIQSCRRNDVAPPTTDPTVDDTETVTASISGVVVNENDVPVSGATVKLGSTTITTNAYGVFRFNNAVMSKNNAHIKVTKSGYFNGNRSLMATAGRTHTVRIKLQPKTNTGTISGSGGGFVALPTGGKVTFQPNVITDASGNAYTGTVNVAMAWINPTASDLGSIIQGDLRGVTTTNTERVLETYGMLGVELTGTGGQELKIASGKTAEISIPIPASLQSSAPASIPLWHFDEVTGRWKEEGSANKVGTNYVGTVKHFSFWNCDVPANFVNLCVNVTNTSGQPLNNVQVRIRKASSPAVSATGTTDSLGNVCGAVFKNEPLVLEVLDRCGSVVYTQNIGPYSANASINVTATIPSSNTVVITGTVVNCSNVPVSNGAVVINTGGAYYYNVPTNSSGNFSLTILNCSSGTVNYSVLPVDNSTQQQGVPVGGSSSSATIALGNIQACGTSSAQFVNMLIDGVPYTWSTPTNFIVNDSLFASPVPGFSFGASVSARTNNSGTTGNIASFTFAYNATPGNYPMVSSFINIQGLGSSQQLVTSPAPQVTLTAVGAPFTGFLEGNYNVNMIFQPGNVTRNVVTNFRVRRHQ
jgi:hypothetical protein